MLYRLITRTGLLICIGFLSEKDGFAQPIPDCRLPTLRAVRLICTDTTLKEYSHRVHAAYSAATKALTELAARKLLAKDQNEWLASLDESCNLPERMLDGRHRDVDCLAAMLSYRQAWLQDVAILGYVPSREPSAARLREADIPGRYTTGGYSSHSNFSWHGNMTIVRTHEAFAVSIETSVGMGLECRVDGTARIVDELLTVFAPSEETQVNDRCVLTLRAIERGFKIEATDPGPCKSFCLGDGRLDWHYYKILHLQRKTHP